MVEQLIRLIVHSRSLLRPPRSSKFLDRSIFCLDHSYAEGQLIRISLFDSHAVKIHNQLETMRGDPRVVVATSVDPKMVGCRLFLNATSGTHIYFDKETTAGSVFL